MSDYIKINSIPELRQAIAEAEHIYVWSSCFGLKATYVKIDREDARQLMSACPDDATTKDLGIPISYIAGLCRTTLYIG